MLSYFDLKKALALQEAETPSLLHMTANSCGCTVVVVMVEVGAGVNCGDCGGGSDGGGICV